MVHPPAVEKKIRPVILAGGSGTRLWPVSRASHPKQFTRLSGGETLFQATVRRLTGEGFAPPLVVTAEPFRFLAAEQIDEIGVGAEAVLIEPEPKNTAPAVAAALAWALQRSEGPLLIAPSDHAIADAAGFRAVVQAALSTAGIVTFGVTPDRAETGYGWLELGAGADPAGEGVQPLAGFVEKPDADTAVRMLAGARHLWNAGLVMARPAALEAAFAAHAPAILDGARRALDTARADLGFTRLNPAEWSLLETVSLDVAVLENVPDLTVMPWRGGWSDLGSWDAVWRNSGGGTVAGEGVLAVGCAGSYLAAGEGVRLVGIGLRDMVAVATADAVLVAPREAAQAVGDAVAELKAQGVPEATAHPRDHRPWGWFETLALGDRFRVKRIVVKPGGRLSLQSHSRRAEHWVVVEGTARVTIGETVKRLGENQSVYVPVGRKHRLENPTETPVVLIEVQTGAYLEEDDIARFDDVYARD